MGGVMCPCGIRITALTAAEHYATMPHLPGHEPTFETFRDMFRSASADLAAAKAAPKRRGRSRRSCPTPASDA